MKIGIPVIHVQLSERGLIAFTIIVCCTSLLLAGKDSSVGYTLIAVVAGYYGIEIPISIVQRDRRRKG